MCPAVRSMHFINQFRTVRKHFQPPPAACVERQVNCAVLDNTHEMVSWISIDGKDYPVILLSLGKWWTEKASQLSSVLFKKTCP